MQLAVQTLQSKLIIAWFSLLRLGGLRSQQTVDTSQADIGNRTSSFVRSDDVRMAEVSEVKDGSSEHGGDFTTADVVGANKLYVNSEDGTVRCTSVYQLHHSHVDNAVSRSEITGWSQWGANAAWPPPHYGAELGQSGAPENWHAYHGHHYGQAHHSHQSYLQHPIPGPGGDMYQSHHTTYNAAHGYVCHLAPVSRRVLCEGGVLERCVGACVN